MNVPSWITKPMFAWGPTLAVLVGGIVVLLLLRRFLGRKHKPDGSLTVMRQLFMLCSTGALAIALIIVLPVGDSLRGQLVTLLGLLATAAIALASTTFLGNVMAGLMLRAIKSFRPGDFVRLGDHFGRVSVTGLLHTEIQTEDGDLTTLPNLLFATNAVTVVRATGTIVSATVSLGYDVHRERVEAALLEAAKLAGLVDPFVLLLELGDYSVSYRVAGTLTEVKTLLSTRSRLRASMLDSLHDSKIEIVSPSFMNQRILEPQRQLIPVKETSPVVHASDEPPEERIFDKAEAAEKAIIDEALEPKS